MSDDDFASLVRVKVVTSSELGSGIGSPTSAVIGRSYLSSGVASPLSNRLTVTSPSPLPVVEDLASVSRRNTRSDRQPAAPRAMSTSSSPTNLQTTTSDGIELAIGLFRVIAASAPVPGGQAVAEAVLQIIDVVDVSLGDLLEWRQTTYLSVIERIQAMKTNRAKWGALSARVYEIGIVALRPLHGEEGTDISDNFRDSLDRLGR